MLPATYRAKKQEIIKTSRKGRKYFSTYYYMKVYCDESLISPTFAIVVSTKVDKRATVRNRIRRLFKAAILNILDETPDFFPKGVYVFYIKDAEVKNKKMKEVKESILNI